jgi:hypothetical protein
VRTIVFKRIIFAPIPEDGDEKITDAILSPLSLRNVFDAG